MHDLIRIVRYKINCTAERRLIIVKEERIRIGYENGGRLIFRLMLGRWIIGSWTHVAAVISLGHCRPVDRVTRSCSSSGCAAAAGLFLLSRWWADAANRWVGCSLQSRWWCSAGGQKLRVITRITTPKSCQTIRSLGIGVEIVWVAVSWTRWRIETVGSGRSVSYLKQQ